MKAGSITFSTALDNKQLEKDLSSLTKKIEEKERKIAELTAKRDEAKGKLDTFDSGELDAEQKKLEEMKAAREKYAEISKKIVSSEEKEKKITADIAQKESERADAFRQRSEILDRLSVAEGRLGNLENAPIIDKDKIKEQKEEISILAREMGKLDDAVQRYDAEIRRSTESLEKQKSLSAQLTQQLDSDAPSKDQVDTQTEKVKNLNAEWNEAKRAVERYNTKLSEAEGELSRQKEEAGYIVRQLDEAKKSAGGMGDMISRTENRIARLGKRILSLAASALVFNVISRGLTSLQQLTMKYIKTNDEARQAIAQLKGALLTLAQPLIEVIIPAFVTFVNILTKIIAVVAQLVSALFGKTVKQSKDGAKALYKEANAIGAVGEAADEAAGSLAGFDEINTINTENAKGAGGAGAGVDGEIAPDFSFLDGTSSVMQDIMDMLERIAPLVAMIGAGFALWKIGSMLPGILGKIATALGLILIAIGGILLFWDGLKNAWENGVDWGNLIEMMLGLAAAAAALYALLGPVAAGIVLIVGGLAMLVTGFRDAMENGWNLKNTLLSIAGILATGLGIALLTGSWIPLLIAAIASVLLALTVATGHGEELLDGIREVIEGFKDFFVGIFTGDIEKAIGGIEKIFEGLKKTVFAVIDGIKDSFLNFLDWLDEKTGGKFHGIIEMAKGFITAFYDNMKTTLGGWIDGIKTALQGLIKFLTGVFTNDWDMAWEGVKEIFKGMWNSNISLLEGAINLIITGLNWLISQMNKIQFDVPEWVPGIGGKSVGVNIPSISEVQIPHLAQGAVIPPNREFMAVLGDQRSGTNLEAPEDLIRKIVREESGGWNDEIIQMLQSILDAVKDGHIIVVDGQTFGRTAIKTINSVNAAAGKQLLKI